MGDNPRLVASYVQPELELVKSWGEQGSVDGEKELMPGVSVIPTGGHSTGHQAIVVRGHWRRRQDSRVLRRPVRAPWAANPRWVTAFDDFPLDSVARKAELFAQAADEGWLIALSIAARRSGTSGATATDPVRADLGRGADLGQHRLDQRLRALLVDRTADDLADRAVDVDEELGREGEPR